MPGEHRRKICVVTTNRSDWSKLYPVARELSSFKEIKLDVIALGSHMLHELGETVKLVQAQFPKTYALHTLVAGNSNASMTDSVGFGIVKVAGVLTAIQPDVVVIHGDRFDAFCTAIAANMLNFNIAHIEGGELSGTIDGTLRHAITKLSHVHFACTIEAARRIRAMGETPKSVFVTGCPSYDGLFSLNLSSCGEDNMRSFLSPCSFELSRKKYLLVLMHPITDNRDESESVYDTLLSALFSLKIPTIMFYPNIDPGNKTLIQILHKYQKLHEDWSAWLQLVTHVQPEKFMVLMMHAAAMLGNSSAGIRETCVFGTPTLNLGSRQDGRRSPQNVATLTTPTNEAIVEWLHKNMGRVYPPSTVYGKPDSAKQIADILRTVDTKVKFKTFWETRYSLLPPPLPAACPKATGLNRSAKLKVLALITARGGSKGIPGKNIVYLDGKPLLQYSVEAAQKAALVDKVIISTDSQDIARVARNCGCEVPFMRPSHLAQDDSDHLSCIVHALDVLRETEGYEPDCVLLLQPTSPLRTCEDIDSSVRIMQATDCDLVVSVCEASMNLSKSVYMSDDGQIIPFAEVTTDETYIRRQALPKTFQENGAIFLQKTASLRSPVEHVPNFGSLRSEDIRGYVMPKARSLDIDTKFDLHLAELLLRNPFG